MSGVRPGAAVVLALLLSAPPSTYAAPPTAAVRSAEPEPGDSFDPVSSAAASGGSYSCVWGTGAGNIWAVGLSGQLARWDGQSFVRVPSEAHEHLRALWGTGPDNVWALGNSETVHWDGQAARLVPSARGFFLTGMWGPDRDHAWAVGRGGVILRMDHGVFQKEAAPVAESIELKAVWGSSASDIWAVGERGTLLHSDGQTWRPVDAGGAGVHSTWYGVWGSGASDVWIVGEAGTILRWDGLRWVRMRSGPREKLRSVFGSRRDDVWIVGDGGIALHWNGQVLLPIAEGGAKNHWSVWCPAPQEVWLGTPEGPLRYRGAPAAAAGGLACTPAARRCQADAIEVCNATGSAWRAITSCPGGCSNGACAAPCSPGTRRCAAQGVEVCDPVSSRWRSQPLDPKATVRVITDASGASQLGGIVVATELWDCALLHNAGCPGNNLVSPEAISSCPGFAAWHKQYVKPAKR